MANILNLTYAPYHYNCDSLPGDDRSKVILSMGKPRALVIFVHGFRGDAMETWKAFDELAITNPAFQNTDLLFFGYDGYHSNVLAGSSFLYDLLDSVDSNPQTLVGPGQLHLEQARQGGYDRIVLVAHSLGAVVCRWAILRSVELGRPWRSKLRLLLFAPAHSGSDLASMATSAASGFRWVELFVEAAKANVPLVKELDPGSKVLAALAERVKAYNEPCLKANRVVVAEREIVVSNLPFPGDPCPDALRDTDHVSVCKPSTPSDRRLGFIVELLK